jgi:Na+-transporting NADH:ubiquinone oxidoreductase subunit F
MFPIGAFFIGVGTAAAIAAVLALVMAIADATIANYGEVKISINDGSKELMVDGGRPLLSTLTSEGIFIPSACGGRGSCGLCKLAVKSGAGEYAPTELPWITEADRKANVRLSCQVKVKREMQIVVPEELFSIKQYETTVASIRDLTYDIKEVDQARTTRKPWTSRPGATCSSWCRPTS